MLGVVVAADGPEGGGGGGGWPLSPYCRAHACGQEACGERSAGASGFCQAHARCRRPGCADGVDARGPDPTLCGEHNRNGPGRTVRRGVLNLQPFGYGGGGGGGDGVGGGGGGGGGWPGLGNWGINATL
ncbi:hypothetical protein LX32DRAFT_668972 [Colletotrichum zoysiae]|uniref:Uncharacterized protein n=1 Tax=Colletotrichum zoysiae TaxID=1216348 RepID=A0AAD9H3X9_9PEZI|nr:hypothetical protein LX32DRAFT_668972 [Colletotrichum zoysiae]